MFSDLLASPLRPSSEKKGEANRHPKDIPVLKSSLDKHLEAVRGNNRRNNGTIGTRRPIIASHRTIEK